MATVSLDLFMPDVQLDCPGVPYPIAINAIRNACIEFCRKSQWWNSTSAAVNYTANNADYTLTTESAEAQIVSVISLNLDGVKTVDPATIVQVDSGYPSWRTTKSQPKAYIQKNPGSVTLVPVPDKDGQFTPTVAYAPTRTGTVVDSGVYDIHFETIKHGAVARLKMSAGHPWSDPNGAAIAQQQFTAGINAAMLEKTRGKSNAVLSVNLGVVV